VVIDGEDVAGVSEAELRRKIGTPTGQLERLF
jgi:hypothetical protein